MFDTCDITNKPINKCPCKECREACKLAEILMKDEKFFLAIFGVDNSIDLLIMHHAITIAKT